MPTPNPLAPVKGAGTTLWVYNGNGDPYANPLSDNDWSRLAKVKDLTPGELTAESYDDSYLDDEDADWAATGQGRNPLEIPASRWRGCPESRGSRRCWRGLMR